MKLYKIKKVKEYMDLELIRKLDYFNIYANLGFQIDGVDKVVWVLN